MTRRLFAALTIALGLLVTGCRVDVYTEVSVRDDGSGDVAVTVVADEEVVRAAPTIADDLALDDAHAAGWVVDGPRLTADGSLEVVLRKPFRSIDEAQEVLAELSGQHGPFRALALAQERSFAVIETTFTGTGVVEGGLAAFADNDLVAALGGAQPFQQALGDRPLAEALGISLTLRLPGSVAASSETAEVTADAKAATYRIPVDGTSIDLATTAEQRDETALAARKRERLAIGGLLLWVVLLVGGGSVWYLRRRNPTTEPDAPRAEAGERRSSGSRAEPAPDSPDAARPTEVSHPIDPGLAPARRPDPDGG